MKTSKHRAGTALHHRLTVHPARRGTSAHRVEDGVEDRVEDGVEDGVEDRVTDRSDVLLVEGDIAVVLLVHVQVLDQSVVQEVLEGAQSVG